MIQGIMIFWAGLIGCLAGGQDELPLVTIRTERQTIQIADPVTVEVLVKANADAEVIFPSIEDNWGKFEVIDSRDQFGIPSINDDEQATWLRQLTLETLETGTLQLPQLEIVVRDGTNLQRLLTEPTTIRVASTIEEGSDPKQFRGIRGVIDLPETAPKSSSWIYWFLAGGTTLLALVGLGTFLFQRKSWITPSRWAIDQIDRESTDISEYDRVLKTFLADHFGFPATSMTAVNIEEELKKVPVPIETISGLSDTLRSLEQSKFAGRKIPESEMVGLKEELILSIKKLSSIPRESS